MSVLNQHIDSQYCILLKAMNNMHGVIAKFPKNLIRDIDEQVIIYEIESDRLNLYSGGKLIKKIATPQYAARFIINADVSMRASRLGLEATITRFVDENDKDLPYDSKLFMGIIRSTKDANMLKLEDKLGKLLTQDLMNEDVADDDVIDVPNDIADGFEAFMNFYDEETNNE